MARPIKLGLDYFPLDVDIFMNLKIRKLIKKFGCKGLTLYFSFLCEIYKHSYYILADDDLVFDISDRLNLATEEVKEVMRYMLEIDLFDRNLFEEKKAITSKSIQIRYTLAKGKSLRFDASNMAFWLLGPDDEILYSSNNVDTQNNTEEPDVVLQETTGVNPTITEVNPETMPQSKEKYSRVLKEKEKKIKEREGAKHSLPTRVRAFAGLSKFSPSLILIKIFFFKTKNGVMCLSLSLLQKI